LARKTSFNKEHAKQFYAKMATFNEENDKLFYDKVFEVPSRHPPGPSKIWNTDETGSNNCVETKRNCRWKEGEEGRNRDQCLAVRTDNSCSANQCPGHLQPSNVTLSKKEFS
jgi:hypothetical protein